MPPPVIQPRTALAVWELTLKCNLACGHCGSRAGSKREDELSAEEALDLVRQLAESGIQEVTIEGGEAFLRPDWLDIARAISAHGMRCTMVTGGYGLSRETARKMKEVGIAHVSVSVDGLAATHDRIRGKPGSFRFCFETLGHFREVGLPFSANTQINRLSAPELPELYVRLRDAGIRAWQLQLTSPMGNGADNAWMLLQPAELPELYRTLARVAVRALKEERLALAPANDIGYYGPYDEWLFASLGKGWSGCMAGLSVLGIHADGSVKGCPTLPSEYIGGNIRQQPLSDILETRELTFNMGAGAPEGVSHMWGYCGGCRYAEACRGGCSQMAHTLFNQRGNNPYCHYRSLELAGRGLRERVVRATPGPGRPFDHGVFELVEEPLGAPWPEDDTHRFTAERVVWPPGWEAYPLPEARPVPSRAQAG
ncbi:heme biosynthesis protein [Cystobacter fuscus DSM 2262]|uniref:Heme biosynthesis protein n=1 Tax=Cystobacter fuscus (strain ATCC 25194 / DSM 2262 / NBRC 100088 / M29) TaxID=1242864 RepID=S9PEG9_CYSF2|nr:radical SAM protein [Cystobacter fuscus]EPX60747.1 heme biosynthesis protein [Cystobacter fuscus DSM 2262]